MKQIFKSRILLSVTFGLTIAGIIARTLAYLLYYDAGIGYLVKGNVFSGIWAAVLAVGIILSLLIAVFGKKQFTPASNRPSACTVDAKCSAIISMAACFLGALYFINKLIDKKPGALTLAGAIACVIAAYHYVTVASGGQAKQTSCLLTGYVVPIAFTLMIADMYFEMTITLNNPDKVMFICSFMLFMVFYLFELRFMIERPLPSFYIASGILAVTVGAAASVPYLISVFCNVYDRVIMSASALMILALTIAFLLRLTSYIRGCDKATINEEISKESGTDNSPTELESVVSVKSDKNDEVKESTKPESEEEKSPDTPTDEK